MLSSRRYLRNPAAACTRCRKVTAARMAAPSSSSTDQSTEVLSKFLAWSSPGLANIPCHIAQLPTPHCRGLVATMDIAPHTIILSVPWDRIFKSQVQPESVLQMHWSAEMAVRLLVERSAGPASAWAPWLAALPAHVATPLEWSAAEVAAVGDPGIQSEVLGMQACITACWEEVREDVESAGGGEADFRGAVQLLHSRCFFDPESGSHLAVPGIDMANHEGVTPSASVAVQHSPGAVQGWAALEEVCDPRAALPGCSQSRFNLVAGAAGLRAGQEITISYGAWPDAAFCLLFGFVPQVNPHNSCCLFPTVLHMARSLASMLMHLSEPTPAPASSAQSTTRGDSTPAAAAAPAAPAAAAWTGAGHPGVGISHTGQTGGHTRANAVHTGETVLEALEPYLLSAWHGSCVPTAEPGLQQASLELSQLVVTEEGWDGRLPAALHAACQLLETALEEAVRAQGHQGRPSAPTQHLASELDSSAATEARDLHGAPCQDVADALASLGAKVRVRGQLAAAGQTSQHVSSPLLQLLSYAAAEHVKLLQQAALAEDAAATSLPSMVRSRLLALLLEFQAQLPQSAQSQLC
ncbi:hypothetical protein V8C86DRAFT_797283 [Haematococcus lacustris]